MVESSSWDAGHDFCTTNFQLVPASTNLDHRYETEYEKNIAYNEPGFFQVPFWTSNGKKIQKSKIDFQKNEWKE